VGQLPAALQPIKSIFGAAIPSIAMLAVGDTICSGLCFTFLGRFAADNNSALSSALRRRGRLCRICPLNVCDGFDISRNADVVSAEGRFSHSMWSAVTIT
jgi:hypothetical protein